MNRKPKRPRRQKRARPGEPQVITRAVTHIRLVEVNPGKLATLDELAPIYLALCQQYVIHFCTQADPNSYAVPVYATELSERWQRVACKKIAELDALIERVAAMRDLLQRRCECADLDECGRKLVEAKARRTLLGG